MLVSHRTRSLLLTPVVLAVGLTAVLVSSSQATLVPPDVAAPPDDAETSSTGLAWKVLEAGTGTAHPSATSSVTVHYVGWTTDGQMFDSSVARGIPATLPLNRVIKGWTEGIQLMVIGEKRRFWIPPDLGYGEQGAVGGLIPRNATLVFDVELLAIQ